MINNTWYINHLRQIKEKSDPRYTPHLNIELPISEIFEGISKNKKFYTEIRKEYGELTNEFKYVASQYEDSALQTLYNESKQDIDNLLKIIDSIKNYNTEQIPWDNIYKQAQKLTENLWVFSDNLRKEKDRVKHIKAPINKNGGHQQSPSEKIDSYIYHIRKTIEVIRWFEEISSSTKAKLSNNPFLLITGKAGRGKTHLLCDVAENRINNNNPLPTFTVFGEYFYNEEDFWTQALKQLQINNTITKEGFLSELDSLGKEAKCRSLFIIDALNENIPQAPNFWKNNLSGIIDDIKQYPNIALVISVRLGFENEVLTEKQKSLFVEEEHQGFQFKEWEAVNKFFKEFKLPLPEIPLLTPEFKEPLFLLLFCKAFQKRKGKKKQ